MHDATKHKSHAWLEVSLDVVDMCDIFQRSPPGALHFLRAIISGYILAQFGVPICVWHDFQAPGDVDVPLFNISFFKSPKVLGIHWHAVHVYAVN